MKFMKLNEVLAYSSLEISEMDSDELGVFKKSVTGYLEHLDETVKNFVFDTSSDLYKTLLAKQEKLKVLKANLA